MDGHELVPLNEMPTSMAGIHDTHMNKYKGREEILKRRVPLLNCLWNDAVQFIPFNPQKVFELQVTLGLIPKVPPYRFYEINLDLFDPGKAVIFFKPASNEENTEVKWLRDVNLETIQEIPEATVDYYKSLIGTGKLPFNYQFIPHILYMGPIDISNAPIITLHT